MRRIKTALLITIGLLSVAMIAANCPTHDCSNVRLLPGGGEVCGGGNSIPFVPTQPAPTATAVPPPSPVLTSLSRYMGTTASGESYNIGCLRATRNDRGTVIMDYGRGEKQAGVVGVLLLGQDVFAPLSAVESSLRQFVNGYIACAEGLDHIELAVGTNNEAGSNSDATMTEIGQAWTSMVIAVKSYVYTSDYSGRIAVVAANDIEPGFGDYQSTDAWLDGFAAAAGSPPALPYLNFGSADGCSTTIVTGAECANGWTQEDVLEVSWRFYAALAFPEIYRTDGTNAAQWQKIALRSATLHNDKMLFHGVLVQYDACQTRDCPGTDNTMADGWRQLLYALNADTRTANSLASSASDIGWDE